MPSASLEGASELLDWGVDDAEQQGGAADGAAWGATAHETSSVSFAVNPRMIMSVISILNV